MAPDRESPSYCEREFCEGRGHDVALACYSCTAPGPQVLAAVLRRNRFHAGLIDHRVTNDGDEENSNTKERRTEGAGGLHTELVPALSPAQQIEGKAIMNTCGSGPLQLGLMPTLKFEAETATTKSHMYIAQMQLERCCIPIVTDVLV